MRRAVAAVAAVSARRPDRAGVLLRRLLRRAAADRRRSSRGRSCSRWPRRARAAPAGRAGPAGARRARAADGVERALVAWAPLRGPAADDVERLAALRRRLLARVGAAAATARRARGRAGARRRRDVVIGYGLAGRLLPGIVDLEPTRAAPAGGSSSRSPTGTRRARWPRSGSCCARALAGDRTPPVRGARRRRGGRGAARRRRLPDVLARRDRGRRASGSSCWSPSAPTRAQLRGGGVALGAGAPRRAPRPRCPASRSLEGTPPRRATARSRSRCSPCSPRRGAARRARRGGAADAPRCRRCTAGSRRAAAAVVLARSPSAWSSAACGERPTTPSSPPAPTPAA